MPVFLNRIVAPHFLHGSPLRSYTHRPLPGCRLFVVRRPRAGARLRRPGLGRQRLQYRLAIQATPEQRGAKGFVGKPFDPEALIESTKQVLWANLEASSLEAALHMENRSQILASTSGEMLEAPNAVLPRRQR